MERANRFFFWLNAGLGPLNLGLYTFSPEPLIWNLVVGIFAVAMFVMCAVMNKAMTDRYTP